MDSSASASVAGDKAIRKLKVNICAASCFMFILALVFLANAVCKWEVDRSIDDSVALLLFQVVKLSI